MWARPVFGLGWQNSLDISLRVQIVSEISKNVEKGNPEKKAPDSCPDNFRRCRFQISIFWMNWMIEEVALRTLPFTQFRTRQQTLSWNEWAANLSWVLEWSYYYCTWAWLWVRNPRTSIHFSRQKAKKNVSDLKRATSQRARTAHFFLGQIRHYTGSWGRHHLEIEWILPLCARTKGPRYCRHVRFSSLFCAAFLGDFNARKRQQTCEMETSPDAEMMHR